MIYLSLNTHNYSYILDCLNTTDNTNHSDDSSLCCYYCRIIKYLKIVTTFSGLGNDGDKNVNNIYYLRGSLRLQQCSTEDGERGKCLCGLQFGVQKRRGEGVYRLYTSWYSHSGGGEWSQSPHLFLPSHTFYNSSPQSPLPCSH